MCTQQYVRTVCFVALMVIGIVCATGCGTTANVVQAGYRPTCEMMRVYGGVRNDIDNASSIIAGLSSGDNPAESLGEMLIAFYLLAVDLPLSAILDTVTLPFVLTSDSALISW